MIYSYEESVFNPGEPESQNLADMIAAQVARNYGLFCRSITLHGTFDETDRSFIRVFVAKGLRQEEIGYRQLGHMLAQKGLLNLTEDQKKFFAERPEVLKLRFDPRVSPLNSIPMDLRAPLLQILLQHASGTVRRAGKRWTDFSPLQDSEMSKPFAFELDDDGQAVAARGEAVPESSRGCVWGELTWPEARARFDEITVALLPVGSVEQHGPHLPLDTDVFDADYLARRVAEACSDPKPLVLPAISYGVSCHHKDFQGTISISDDTLVRIVYEINISMAENGIRKLVIINGHGGNSPALNHAAQMIKRDTHIFVCVDSGETSDVDIYEFIDTPNDVHAGEIETSTSLAVRPNLVKMDLAPKTIPEFSSRYLDFTSNRGVSWYAYTQKISATGVMGDPTRASIAKGKKIWQIMIAHLAALVEDIKTMTLEEIHHRKY